MSSSRKATARQRLRHALIAQWRGVADGPLLDCPVAAVSDLVPKIVAQCGLSERLQMEEVSAAWTGIVGDFIARQTAPDGLKRGVLTIRVLQPAVHHTLMMEKARLMAKLQERFGASEVRDLKFRHG